MCFTLCTPSSVQSLSTYLSEACRGSPLQNASIRCHSAFVLYNPLPSAASAWQWYMPLKSAKSFLLHSCLKIEVLPCIKQVASELRRPTVFISTHQWRTEGAWVWGVQPPPPRNSEGPPKSCQTQPDCEKC